MIRRAAGLPQGGIDSLIWLGTNVKKARPLWNSITGRDCRIPVHKQEPQLGLEPPQTFHLAPNELVVRSFR